MSKICLSDHIFSSDLCDECLSVGAVREAVRLLKEFAKEHDDMVFKVPNGHRYNADCNFSFTWMIDKIFGDKRSCAN